MKIGVIGTGNIGGNLGKVWAEKGHEVMFGTRDPNSDRVNHLLASINGNASASNIRAAAGFGGVVLIATPWEAVSDTLEAAGDLSGKVIIDATNPLKWDNGPIAALLDSSASEVIQDSRPVRGWSRRSTPLGLSIWWTRNSAG